MNFEELKIIAPLLKAVRQQGYVTPTPIQELAIPHVLAGRDIMGCAQTGTGKTAAFVLPILQNLQAAAASNGKRRIRTLVVAPTRELASQIGESFAALGFYLRFRHTVVFGGVSQYRQTKALTAGVDILVATPGRLLDLMNQGFVDLRSIEIFVLDEGDRMLDMGFIHDIRRIVAALPKKRQTLLFSATVPQGIRELGSGILNRPVEVAVTPSASTVESVEQSVFFVDKSNKIPLLVHLLAQKEKTRVLVFTRTKHGADGVVRNLARASITAEAIHSNKSQRERERILQAFKQGTSRVLVATDIAARGLDIDQISHVVNFDIPDDPETYVHRIGRTARAGLSGVAHSFCGRDENSLLISIERLIRKRLTVENDHPFRVAPPITAKPKVIYSSSRRRPPRRMSGHSGQRLASTTSPFAFSGSRAR